MPAPPSSLSEKSQPPALMFSSSRNVSLSGRAPVSTPPRLQRLGSNSIGFSLAPPLAPRLPSDGPRRPFLSPRGSPPKTIIPPSKNPPAPNAMASISGSGSSFSSPIETKKQKTQDRLKLTLGTDALFPSDYSEYRRDEGSNATAAMGGGNGSAATSPVSSPGAAPALRLFPPSIMPHGDLGPTPRGMGTPPSAPAAAPTLFCPSVASPSTPSDVHISPSTSSPRKRSLPSDDGDTGHAELSSPFTPRGRRMMQNLGINSPSSGPSLESRSRSRWCPIDALDARETILDSPMSTPLETPKTGPLCHLTAASSAGSPFQSMLGQRAPIGNHRGSVFKMTPQRNIYQNGRDEASSSSPYMSSSPSVPCGNLLPESPYSSSPSPRMVPLTVLSQDGSPAKTPKRHMPGLPDPSSLLPSHFICLQDAQDETDSVSPDPDMPHVFSVRSSPESNKSHRVLPGFKLTPRTSPSSPRDTQLMKPRFMQRRGVALPPLPAFAQPDKEPRTIINPASSLLSDRDSPREKAASGTDSLLTGFEHHNATDEREDREQESNIKHTLGPSQMPSLWLPPSVAVQEKRECPSASTFSDSNSTHTKPMPSITFNLRSSRQGVHASNAFDTGPSFLPRQGALPIPHATPCSLFKSSANARDPIERMIRADAIAEAARSEEPLTDDDDSYNDVDNADFFLCLPRKNQANETYSTTSTKKYPLKSSHVSLLADSPSNSLFTSARSGSFSRRCGSLASSPTPTVFEEGYQTKKTVHPIGTQEGVHEWNKCETPDETFTTVSSQYGDPSATIASSKYSRAKAMSASKDRLSVCSMLSTSSLCGLDIVHEASLGKQGSNKVPVSSQSKASEYLTTTGMFKSLQSELSLTSFGLSVDSTEVGPNQRDLFTPPVTSGLKANKHISPRDLCTPPVIEGRTSKQMLSPPPLRCVWH